MANENGAVAYGLDGVVVAKTEMSEVDGTRGRLVVRGHDVESLAGRVPFEAVCFLLREGCLPTSAELEETRRALGAARERAFKLVACGGATTALRATDGMDALRAAVALLSASAAPAWADVTGAVAVFAAAWNRVREGREPIPPDAAIGHAADYLRMSAGNYDGARAGALDAYLVTVADHGMNASTFTARVVASTGSDTVSSIVAAIGALKGPLHGGAPGPVLDMLDAVARPELARVWVEAELAAGRRIMGMGHRIYRVRDPRAAVLELAIERLEAVGVGGERLALARAVEREAEAILGERYPDRPLRANVEFYTAVLLDAVGLPREAFTATFAVGRVAGWLAHVEEQRATGRLVRPASEYVGPLPSPASALLAT
jgi:citrate synthase